MSDASEAAAMDPEVRALEIANQKAQFEQLNIEWNEAYRAGDNRIAEMIDISRRQRACGLRITQLERAHGIVDDYTAGVAR